MLELLKVHGFRTLVNTEIRFDPLTIMIGKNGVGKTTILDSLQLLGNFSRGGIDRAFGPPPGSLSWQRTKGIGYIPAVRFEVQVKTEDRYSYVLSLSEKAGTPLVTEERLMRPDDNRTVASLGPDNQPLSGTILNPEKHAGDPAIEHVFRRAQVGRQLVPVREYPIWTDVGSRGSRSARTEPVTDRESVADSLEMTTPETLLVV